MKISSQEYFAEVKAIAEDIVKDAMEQVDGNRDDALDLINDHLLHEAIDNHQWVIYYAYNLDVYNHSDNKDYYVDNFGTDELSYALKENGLDGLHQALAFWCLYADVLDKSFSILEN